MARLIAGGVAGSCRGPGSSPITSMRSGAGAAGKQASGLRRAVVLISAVLLCAWLPAGALAAPAVKLSASLTPERLGQATTVGFGFQIEAPAGQAPTPLTRIAVRYPANLGLATSGLGVAVCSPATLAASGPGGCPADSRMGSGSAAGEVAIGPEIHQETTDVTIVRGPDENGELALLFFVSGENPIIAQLVLPALLLPASMPFGGLVNIAIPPIPSLPEAPDIALVGLRSTIGAGHLTYYERVHGKLVAYRPNGILLPDSCPRGGFPFAAELTFQDGSRVGAHTAVPCPARAKDKRRSRSPS
jgi:hypothetical protein